MNIRDSQGKKVSFNMQDDLEQKIDKLTVIMDKLVTEDSRCSKPFRPQIYQPSRGRNKKIEESFMADLEIMHTGDICRTVKILEVDIEINIIVEEILVIILEAVRDIGIITMITGEAIIEVKGMIGIEVDH